MKQTYISPIVRMLTTIVLTLLCLNIHAQKTETVSPAEMPADGKKHTMTIYFKNNTTVSYQKENLEHVTYLPGVGMKIALKNEAYTIDYLYSEMVKVEYFKEANDNENSNWTAFGWTDYPEAWRLEYPHLNHRVSTTGDANNCQVVVKRTEEYGITYSLEWDNAKIANRWTCYQLHEGNTKSDAQRDDDFKADDEVFKSSTLEDYKGSGFSRGHLCPSADRLCSKEQNKQTFFLTNMQPQYQTHNGGLWGRLEDEVRSYATDDKYTDSHCDTLYVVKAATITDWVEIDGEQVDGVYKKEGGYYDLCNDNLLVPKFFYMALLHYNKETDTYQALAFWTKHINEKQSVANLGDYAISIDELEKRTGIDFFCNLPDDIEAAVEATIDLNFWHLSKSAQ